MHASESSKPSSAAALGEKSNKKHIVSTKFEHHAVLHTLDALARSTPKKHSSTEPHLWWRAGTGQARRYQKYSRHCWHGCRA